MTAPRSLDARLQALEDLRADLPAAEAIAALRAALKAKTGLLVAKAATITGQSGLPELAGDLVEAFERLCPSPPKADKGCLAKTAIAEALLRVGEDASPDVDVRERVFLPGARLRQPEPGFGGSADAAGALRSACAIGLARWHHPDTLDVLAELLADEDPGVRVTALRALVWRGAVDAVPVLRLRVRMGDPDPRVRGESSRALLALAGAAGLPLVAAHLEDEDVVHFAETALALGESHLPEAFDALRSAWEGTLDEERREVLVAALAALRLDESIAFLLAQIESGGRETARRAIDALAAHGGDAALGRRVREATRQRGARDLEAHVAAAFPALEA